MVGGYSRSVGNVNPPGKAEMNEEAMSEEHDASFTEPGSSEPIGEPLGPDRLLLSLVSVLWLLNSAIGAVVALREQLPA